MGREEEEEEKEEEEEEEGAEMRGTIAVTFPSTIILSDCPLPLPFSLRFFSCSSLSLLP